MEELIAKDVAKAIILIRDILHKIDAESAKAENIDII